MKGNLPLVALLALVVATPSFGMDLSALVIKTKATARTARQALVTMSRTGSAGLKETLSNNPALLASAGLGAFAAGAALKTWRATKGTSADKALEVLEKPSVMAPAAFCLATTLASCVTKDTVALLLKDCPFYAAASVLAAVPVYKGYHAIKVCLAGKALKEKGITHVAAQDAQRIEELMLTGLGAPFRNMSYSGEVVDALKGVMEGIVARSGLNAEQRKCIECIQAMIQDASISFNALREARQERQNLRRNPNKLCLTRFVNELHRLMANIERQEKISRQELQALLARVRAFVRQLNYVAH